MIGKNTVLNKKTEIVSKYETRDLHGRKLFQVAKKVGDKEEVIGVGNSYREAYLDLNRKLKL